MSILIVFLKIKKKSKNIILSINKRFSWPQELQHLSEGGEYICLLGSLYVHYMPLHVSTEYSDHHGKSFLPVVIIMYNSHLWVSDTDPIDWSWTAYNHHLFLHVYYCNYNCAWCVSTLPLPQELYLAYNSVSDLSQIGMLENLQLIDLEGNDVDDLVQVQYLGLCDKLQTLTLEGNPVCMRPNPTAIQVL